MEQKGSKTTESRNTLCRAPLQEFFVRLLWSQGSPCGLQGPSTWCHIWKSSVHTWTMSCSPSLTGLQLFPIRSSESWGDLGMGTWESVDYFAFHFQGFLKTAAEIPRPLEKGWSYYIFCQTASWEKWKYYKPIFLKSLSELLQEFLGSPHDLKTEQSPLPNPSAFLALALALHWNMQLNQAQ